MSRRRFLAAAQRFLDGDDSIRAANELEGVVLDDFPGDERFDELGEVLALYAPGQGSPCSEADEVRTIIRRTIASFEQGAHCAERPHLPRSARGAGCWLLAQGRWFFGTSYAADQSDRERETTGPH